MDIFLSPAATSLGYLPTTTMVEVRQQMGEEATSLLPSWSDGWSFELGRLPKDSDREKPVAHGKSDEANCTTPAPFPNTPNVHVFYSPPKHMLVREIRDGQCPMADTKFAYAYTEYLDRKIMTQTTQSYLFKETDQTDHYIG